MLTATAPHPCLCLGGQQRYTHHHFSHLSISSAGVAAGTWWRDRRPNNAHSPASPFHSTLPPPSTDAAATTAFLCACQRATLPSPALPPACHRRSPRSHQHHPTYHPAYRYTSLRTCLPSTGRAAAPCAASARRCRRLDPAQTMLFAFAPKPLLTAT